MSSLIRLYQACPTTGNAQIEEVVDETTRLPVPRRLPDGVHPDHRIGT